MRIRELQKQINDYARSKGWWDEFEYNPDEPFNATNIMYIASKLALVHSEISEALEELRNNKLQLGIYYNPHDESEKPKPEGFEVELADALIRILDLAEALNLDIEEAIRMKMEFNMKRPHKHGGKAI